VKAPDFAKRIVGLTALFVALFATPAAAEPALEFSLTNTPTSLPRNDQRMEYQATVTNTASAAPSVGDTLTCKNSLAQWANMSSEADFAYSWLRNGNEIPGASEKTYVVSAADEGQGVQCRIVATQPEAEPGGAGDEQPIRQPVRLTVRDDGITPQLVKVSAFLGVELIVRNATSRTQVVTLLRARPRRTLSVGAGKTGRLRFAGLRRGRYRIQGSSGARATLVSSLDEP